MNTHTHLGIAHRREREIRKEKEHLFWGFILYIYIEEVLLGFLPLEGFPKYLCLSCDCVSFSDFAYAIVVNLD